MDQNFEKLFKECFENNLHDIRSKLFDISDYTLKKEADKNLSDLKNNYENKLRELKTDYERKITSTENKYQNEIKSLKDDYEKNFRRLSEKVDYYEENYAEIEETFALYNKLNSKQKFSLAGYFGRANNSKEFFSGAVQEKNLKDLWEFVTRNIMSNKSSDEEIHIYMKIFDFCFEMVNKSARSPLYIRLTPKAGEIFDEESMETMPGDKKVGEVKKTIFQGFLYGESKKIVKKSLVALV